MNVAAAPFAQFVNHGTVETDWIGSGGFVHFVLTTNAARTFSDAGTAQA
jgi:hypothetical protein